MAVARPVTTRGLHHRAVIRCRCSVPRLRWQRGTRPRWYIHVGTVRSGALRGSIRGCQWESNGLAPRIHFRGLREQDRAGLAIRRALLAKHNMLVCKPHAYTTLTAIARSKKQKAEHKRPSTKSLDKTEVIFSRIQAKNLNGTRFCGNARRATSR